MSHEHHILRDSGDEPWRDKQLLLDLYEDHDLTYAEIAEKLGCTKSTVSTWMNKHKAADLRDELNVEIPDEKPYQNRELMKTLYLDEELSTTEISGVLDCSTGAVCSWIDRHGIETRSLAEAVSNSHDGGDIPVFYTIESRGYEAINTSDENAYVHRLQAAAYWGVDALDGKHVHHIDGVEWHNTEYNLELVDPSEHSRHHNGQYTVEDEKRAVKLYRSGLSSYDVADKLGCSASTVIAWVRKHQPALVRNNRGEAA